MLRFSLLQNIQAFSSATKMDRLQQGGRMFSLRMFLRENRNVLGSSPVDAALRRVDAVDGEVDFLDSFASHNVASLSGGAACPDDQDDVDGIVETLCSSLAQFWLKTHSLLLTLRNSCGPLSC